MRHGYCMFIIFKISGISCRPRPTLQFNNLQTITTNCQRGMKPNAIYLHEYMVTSKQGLFIYRYDKFKECEYSENTFQCYKTEGLCLRQRIGLNATFLARTAMYIGSWTCLPTLARERDSVSSRRHNWGCWQWDLVGGEKNHSLSIIYKSVVYRLYTSIFQYLYNFFINKH